MLTFATQHATSQKLGRKRETECINGRFLQSTFMGFFFISIKFKKTWYLIVSNKFNKFQWFPIPYLIPLFSKGMKTGKIASTFCGKFGAVSLQILFVGHSISVSKSALFLFTVIVSGYLKRKNKIFKLYLLNKFLQQLVPRCSETIFSIQHFLHLKGNEHL